MLEFFCMVINNKLKLIGIPDHWVKFSPASTKWGSKLWGETTDDPKFCTSTCRSSKCHTRMNVNDYLSRLLHSCKLYWLVVSTHLKNTSQIGSFPQVGVKINNIWNHHLVYIGSTLQMFPFWQCRNLPFCSYVSIFRWTSPLAFGGGSPPRNWYNC